LRDKNDFIQTPFVLSWNEHAASSRAFNPSKPIVPAQGAARNGISTSKYPSFFET
jgi:hypothetical protein